MLILIDDLVKKYNIIFKGILHVGAHECEEIIYYEKYLNRNQILWVDAILEKVNFSKNKYQNLLIEHAVVSDKKELVVFNISNNYQSSSILEFGTHKKYYPYIDYVESYYVKTELLENIISKYNISFNFINLDIQGAELKALKGMGKFLNDIDYIYTEVNKDYVYKDCALIDDIDNYLKNFNFIRVETVWNHSETWGNEKWGDAFYIKNHIELNKNILEQNHIELNLINNIKISLCIPTKNRFDNFLNIYLDKYIEYLENGLIDEIIISDEDGIDYNKITNKYKNILDKNNNFKVYKNNEILGVFLNKLKVCSYANNNYIALIDSDNFCEESYFITVKNYILSNNNLSKNLVLSPSFAKPHFSYKKLENIILTKNNINQYTEYENFFMLMNTGNYIITKNIIDNIKYDNTILNNISACDVQYFNLLALKQFEDFQFHIIKNLEYNHIVHNDSEYLKTIKKCNEYASKHVYNEIYNFKKYVIFKPSGRLGNALFRYFASILFCIKYNYEYILEEDIPIIKDYIFYKGVDYPDHDIEYKKGNIDNFKMVCNKNDNALCFNTLGFIKYNFDLSKLCSNDYINEENNNGLYVKNIININDDNYFKFYENCKINNLIMDGYFHFDKIYLENKKEIIEFIEKNKNNHRIKTDRNETFLIKDLIDNIPLDISKIYDVVIHLRLGDFDGLEDFIEYKSIISLIENIDFNNKRCAIVLQKIYTDKDINYVNNLLNWFKQNNIEINVECNDLIMDFNIMKQCKTLICSNSTLSWAAAYLSKNIELCYMPFDKSRNNDEKYLKRFKKPVGNIENNLNECENSSLFSVINVKGNTIFYDVSKKKNCYICGCILNCEKYLKNIFNNIEKIGKIFNNYKVIIAYDESNDNTLNTLFKIKENLNSVCKIEIIINKNKMSIYKSENISNARNSILDFIRTENDDDYEYFIMMDFDDVCEKEINTDILNKYLINNSWDSLSFNRKDYYDIWALSIEPYVTSCWHWNEKQLGSHFVVDIMKDYINNKLNNLDKDKLLECHSAFNGFAIYRKDKFINCDYSNNIFKSHGLINNDLIRNNLSELNKITGNSNSLFMNLLEDCEHRHFHLSAIQKNNAKIMISPLYLFNENINNEITKTSETITITETIENTQNFTNKEEHECTLVSSRGILKSCDVKSIIPISSINQLLNYDFSKLYEGCMLYVCNYAIPYFSTVINQINCRFILVSGDSDCEIPYESFKTNNEFPSFINNEKIIHWYSQNCILNHPKLSRIPIGLDYHTMSEKDSDWGEKISPEEQENILNNIKNNSKLFSEREVKCYANFHFFTNTKYGSDRIEAMNYINKELVFYENNKINRKQTWENQSKYAFVISPHGNGLDCHRTWEALCLGCIPIVKKSGISEDLFYKLPVLIVDHWKDVTIDLLKTTIHKFKNSSFNYEKLTLKYWIDNIRTYGNFNYIPSQKKELIDIVDNLRTDKNTVHSYLNLYENLLNSKKYTAKNILEVGIYKGGSIKMWKDYFVNANVYGLDIININCVWDVIKNNDKIKLYTSVDAYDEDFVKNTFLNKNIKFDMMIDDGPHSLESMKKFINLYLNLLNYDGILIIEDVQSWDWIEILKNEVPEDSKKYIEAYDLRDNKNRFDDIVFVINKNILNNEIIIKNNKKIIDCFTFYNELDLLNYRLNILNDVVDYFVLVESTHTHSGKEKKLFFEENKILFDKFKNKIIHIIVNNLPYKYPNINIDKNEQWINENYQRNCIDLGLQKINILEEDIIIISDLDEIPDPKTLLKIKNNDINITINNLVMDLYYYNLNTKFNEKWFHPKILLYKEYKRINVSCNDIRLNININNNISNGGWHLSYFGNAEFINNKINNQAHQEYNNNYFKDIDNINKRISNFYDLYDNRNYKIQKIGINDNNYLPPEYDKYLKKFIII